MVRPTAGWWTERRIDWNAEVRAPIQQTGAVGA
jgi:hypothetical protein